MGFGHLGFVVDDVPALLKRVEEAGTSISVAVESPTSFESAAETKEALRSRYELAVHSLTPASCSQATRSSSPKACAP